VEQDQSKAMLYYTFAADGGDIRSEMALGYRHHIGISTPRNCEQAVHYYRKVADKAIEYLRSGPPGNHAVVKDSYRIADEEGGVYGEGASVSSAGPNAKQGGPNSDAHASFEDVIEYLDLMSRKGDLKATFSLAKLYYEGSRGMRRDFKLYFMEVARAYWPKKGKQKQDVSPGIEKLASKAAGYLGRMFLRGEGMPQDFEKAQIWFKRGTSNGDSMSQYSMGLMYLNGYGVPKDTVKAAEYFSPAADEGLASAQVRLGALFLDQGDITTAMRYFDHAARNNHIEAFYYLADLIYQGIGRDSSCVMAAVYYKIVAEKAEVAVASFKEANDAYENGDFETALIDYMLAAEQGFENAQANVAYLLDKSKPRFSLSDLLPFAQRKASLVADAGLALLYWTRSAKQSNVDSLVKMGDYYLGGIGTSLDQEKAAACYQAAAETLQSAQAMWNLGWMHENGIGIEQDFHLAKRFYDQALETNNEAYLPVKLSLLKLRARSAWNSFTRGRVNSIRDERGTFILQNLTLTTFEVQSLTCFAEERRRFSFAEWIHAFIEADLAMHENFEHDEWDSLTSEGMPGGEDFYDDFDDGIIESLVIVALAAALAMLLVYRRRRADERRQQQQVQANGVGGQQPQPTQPAAQQAQQQGGLFPNPGDPEFPGWAVGGVGH